MGGCNRQEDANTGRGIDHDCVRGLENQCTDIVGTRDDFSITDAHRVDDLRHTIWGKGRLEMKLRHVVRGARNGLPVGRVFGS
jgi:hypothetical protein